MNIDILELIAVLGVIAWGGALVFFIGRDVVRWKHHHGWLHHQHHSHG